MKENIVRGKGNKVAATKGWEHIADMMYPEDIKTNIEFAENDDERKEVINLAIDEISTVLFDAWDIFHEDNEDEDVEKALNVAQMYIDELQSSGYEVSQYILDDYAKLRNEYYSEIYE